MFNSPSLIFSNWKLNDSDTPSPRVITLQNRWRNVWRMSVDRKKMLQDALDNLLEVNACYGLFTYTETATGTDPSSGGYPYGYSYMM